MVLHFVIDGERKAPSQEAMVPEVQGMDSRVKVQRLDVRIQGVQEVFAKARRSALLETEAIDKILNRLLKDLDFHRLALRIRTLAASNVKNRALPFFARFAREFKILLCQAGAGTSSGARHRSSQRRSMAASLKAVVILLRGTEKSIFDPQGVPFLRIA